MNDPFIKTHGAPQARQNPLDYEPLGPVQQERLNDLHARLDDAAPVAAVAAERDPTSIRRLLNLSGVVGHGPGFLTGTADVWVERLVGLALNHRIDTFLFWPSGDQQRQIQLFAEEVIPAIRNELP